MPILTFPNRVVLELTPICNLSCFMCPRHIMGKNPGYMDETLWCRLIDEIAERDDDIKVLPFWRGESLLHKKFIKLSEYALNKGIKLHISTNGHYVSGDKAKILSMFEFITFSIHTEEGFEKAVKFASRYKTEQNILQVSFVDAERDMSSFMQMVLDDNRLMGFDALRLYNEHSIDGEFGSSSVTLEQERFFCPKLENSIVIGFDGTVSRCNHIWNTENYNVENGSIQDAWKCYELQQIRKHYPDQKCSKCDQWLGRTLGHFWKREGDQIVQKY